MCDRPRVLCADFLCKWLRMCPPWLVGGRGIGHVVYGVRLSKFRSCVSPVATQCTCTTEKVKEKADNKCAVYRVKSVSSIDKNGRWHLSNASEPRSAQNLTHKSDMNHEHLQQKKPNHTTRPADCAPFAPALRAAHPQKKRTTQPRTVRTVGERAKAVLCTPTRLNSAQQQA